MSLEATSVRGMLGKEDIVIGHETSDITITVSVDAEFPTDSWHIPVNSGHGDVISETIKEKNMTDTGLINMKESEHIYIHGVSLQGELSEDQMKVKMETEFNEILEVKDECRDKFTDGVSVEVPLYMDNEFRNEQGVPASIMPEVIPVMPQLCNVFTEQVLTEAPSTWESPRIGEDNMQLHLETVYLTDGLTEWKEEADSLSIQDQLCNIETFDLTESAEGLKSETDLGDVEEESYNLEKELTLEDLVELKVEPRDVGVSLEAQELYVDHEVKDEVVLGPVVLTRPEVAFTAQEVPVETEFESALWEIPIHYETKEEPSRYIDFGARGGLYMNHEVKTEIELQAEAYIQESLKSQEALLGWTCSVQLERIHVDKERRTCRVGHETYKLRGPTTTGHLGDQWRFTFNLSQARQAIENKLKLNALNKLFPTKKTTVSPSTFKGHQKKRKTRTKRSRNATTLKSDTKIKYKLLGDISEMYTSKAASRPKKKHQNTG